MLPYPIGATLHDDNPWWHGERLFGLPGLRWAFDVVLSGVQRGLTPATVLRGPRQVGKTTLLNQVIDALLAKYRAHEMLSEFVVKKHLQIRQLMQQLTRHVSTARCTKGVAGRQIFRVQFDELPALRDITEPILELAHWYAATVLQKSFHQAAHAGEQAYLIFDEIQEKSAMWFWHAQRAVAPHGMAPLIPAGSTAPEVDFVLTVGLQRIPVEVKYRHHIDPRDIAGLQAFLDKPHYNAPFGILVTLLDEMVSDDAHIVPLPLSSLLSMR